MTAHLPAKRDYFTLKEIAEITGANRATLYQMTRTGELAHTRVKDSGKPTILVPRADVEQLLADMEARIVRGPRRHTPKARPIPMNPRFRAG